MGSQGGSVRGVTWAQVDEGFYVGSRTGEFLGYVDRHSPTTYRAFDMTSRMIGTFAELAEAMQAVSSRSRTGADA